MPRPRSSLLRRLRRVCVFLLLGLVTTVGVAWLGSIHQPRVVLEHVRNNYGERPLWLFETPPGWPFDAYRLEQGSKWNVDTAHAAIGVSDEDSHTSYDQRTWRAGYPLRCVHYRVSRERTGDTMVRHRQIPLIDRGLHLGHWSWNALDDARLPLRPIWYGLAFNTAFYALLWWLGFASLRMVKHNRRYRRGLCPVCRYDLRAGYSVGCSECGWGR